MPNVNPQDLPITQAATPGPWGFPPCAHSSCVDIRVQGDLFTVVSTRRPEHTGVPFDGDEVVKFIDEVRAGKWDGVYALAQAAASRMASA